MIIGFCSWGESGNLYSQFKTLNIFADDNGAVGILTFCSYIATGLLCFSVVLLGVYLYLKKNWMRIYGGSFIFVAMAFYLIFLTGSVILNTLLGNNVEYPICLFAFSISNIITLVMSMITLMKSR